MLFVGLTCHEGAAIIFGVNMRDLRLPTSPRLRDAAHWQRKHMGDIACAVKDCSGQTALTHEQRELAARAHDLAHALATGGLPCSDKNLSLATVAFCAFCASGAPGRRPSDCPGRSDWRKPCMLLLRMTA